MSVIALADRARGNAAQAGSLKFLSIGRTHPGCVRALNEDAFLDRSDLGLWVVADGMGGHQAGEVASAMIVERLAKVSAFSSAYAFRNAVCMTLHDVNAELIRRSQDLQTGTIGSTVVALLAHQGHFACVWAGDSRAYLYRDGELRPITRDHSFVQNLIDAGKLSRDEGSKHHSAHVITRAVGASGALELDSAYGPVFPGDRFILCSDGLTGSVRESEIAHLLARPPLEGALERMLSCALSRGAPDNVTAVLIAAESTRRPKS